MRRPTGGHRPRPPAPPAPGELRTARPGGPGRVGLVIIYVLCTLALVALLARHLMGTQESALKSVMRMAFIQMARHAADSGIEHAMAVLDHELSSPADTTGPYLDPTYDPSARGFPWATDTRAAGQEAVGSTIAFFPSRWTSGAKPPAAEFIASRHRLESHLAMWPTFDFTNVREKLNAGEEAEFFIRSRGEVRAEPDTARGAGAFVLMAHAVVIQKIRIGNVQSCNGRPRVERVIWQLDPDAGLDQGPPFTQH